MPREDAAQFNGTLSTATYPNRFNVVIPPEGPFYRIGLKLTVADDTAPNGRRTLIEGLDYYLGYYFKELAEAEQDQIYGGFMLLTATEIEYEILGVARQYRVPQSEIGKFLVRTDLKDPRNVDWSELMAYAPVIQPIDPPANLEEAILRDEVVKALNDIRKKIIQRSTELDAAFTEVTNLIYENGKKIFDEELYQHHLNPNAHQYTTNDVGALPVLGRAVDATKAFGLTIDQLATLMGSAGIEQSDVEQLMGEALGTVYGRWGTTNGNELTFKTPGGHIISIRGDKWLITSPQPLVIKADQDNNESGLAVEFSAGLNTLWVHSGSEQDVLAPVYNSVYLVTPEMVNMYLTSVTLLEANAYFKSSDTVKPYGTAKQSNPLTLNANIPTATESVYGVFSITNIATSVALGTAISQKAVTELKDRLDLYVDDDYTVNGKGFVKTGDNMVLTLTKTDFGIDKMDNTTPIAKPVTKALANVLKNKSLMVHTHTTADLDNVPIGSATVDGILQLWDAIDTTNDKAVTSRQGWLFAKEIKKVSDKLNTILPAWTVGGVKFGNKNFLPIPALGNYSGFTKNQSYQKGVVGFQQGKVYSLRNATNGVPGTEAIYYGYADINTSNAFENPQQTSVKYHPAGMSKYPGVTLKAILIGGQEAIICLGSDNNRYLVLFNGSMDHSKHTVVCRVTMPKYRKGNPSGTVEQTWNPWPEADDVVLVEDHVYLLRSTVNNTAYAVAAWRLRKADLSTNTELEFERVTLTGEMGQFGDNLCLRIGQKTEESQTGQFFTYFPPEARAKWTNGHNFVHGPECNHACGVQDGVIRVNHTPTVWFAANDGSQISFRLWSTSFTINTLTGKVTLEGAERFPLKVDTAKVSFVDGTEVGMNQKWGGGVANNRCFAAYAKPNGAGAVLSCWQSNDADEMPKVSIKGTEGKDFFDYLRYDVLNKASNAETFIWDKGRGSIYTIGLSHPVGIGGSNKVWLSNPRNRYTIEVEVDPSKPYDVPGYSGYGPNNNRREVDPTLYEQLSCMAACMTPEERHGQLNGWYLTKAETFPYRNIYGNFALSSERLTLEEADRQKMIRMIVDGAPSGQANGYANERISAAHQSGNALFALWMLGINTACEFDLLQVSCMKTLSNGRRVLDIYYFMVSPTKENGYLRFNSATFKLVDWFLDLDYGLSYQSLREEAGNKTRRVGQPIFASVDGVNFGLWLPYTLTIRNIWDLNALGYAAKYTFDPGSGWTRVPGKSQLRRMAPAHNPESGCYMGAGNWDKMALIFSKADRVFCSGNAYTAEEFVNDTRFTTGGQAVIIAGVETAEGWILYLTEEVRLDFGSDSYTLPTWSVDLSNEFPENHANQTFYVHAALVGSSAQYQIGLEKLPDTSSRLFVGTVTTDKKRIVAINIDKVKRLGRVRELEEHAAVVDQHDVAAAFDRKTGPLQTLVNQPLKAPTASASKGAGYVDGQKWNTMSGITTRPRLPIQETYAGYKSIGRVAYENCADQFWQKAVAANVAAATASENSQAATANMKWLGAYTKPTTGPNAYLALSLRVRVPGDPGTVNRRLKIRLAAPTGITQVRYGLNQSGGTMTEQTVTLTANSYLEKEHAGFKPAEEVRLHATFVIPKNEYDSYRTKFGAIQLIDVETNTVIKQTDIDTPFIVYTDTELAAQSGLVYKAVKGQFHQLPAQPVVIVTDGQTGTTPPVKTAFSDGTLTVYVATTYDAVNPAQTRDIDKLQFNLMFTS